MKKLISLLLVLAMALSLAACGGKTEAPAATEAPKAEAAPEAAAPAAEVTTYDVGVAIYQYNDNFMTLYRQEIENYFKTLETDTVKYNITMVDSKNDMAEQTNQIDTFITQGMDVIILNLVQTSSAEVLIDKVVAAALAQFGDEIEVVFCNNDGMALGAAAAIEAAGRTVGENIYLLGVDALDECQEMVKAGTMTGTVLNDHIGQSHAAVDAAIAALNGEELQNYYWVDYLKVDAAYFG